MLENYQILHNIVRRYDNIGERFHNIVDRYVTRWYNMWQYCGKIEPYGMIFLNDVTIFENTVGRLNNMGQYC